MDKVGRDAAEFIRVAAEIDPSEVETQAMQVAETQLYSESGPNGGCDNPDEVPTIPAGALPEPSDDSTVEVETAEYAGLNELGEKGEGFGDA